jgi:hypothetical protein
MVRIIGVVAANVPPAGGGLSAGQAYLGVRTMFEKLGQLVDILNSTTKKKATEFVDVPSTRTSTS